MQLTCSNCNATFDGAPSDRCPKCLRLTTVHESASEPVAPGASAARPAPWPDGPACPLCITAVATDATFVIEIPSGAAESAETAGRPRASTSVRCRSCDACRARVERLSRRRAFLLPPVVLVLLAWPALAMSELPMHLHLDRVTAAFGITALCAVLVVVPLVLLDRESRAVRKHIEASWLLRQLLARARVQAGGTAERPDEWKILADARRGAAPIDAPELLRSG